MFSNTMGILTSLLQTPFTLNMSLALASLFLLLFVLLHSCLHVQEKDPKMLPRGSMGWPVLGETLGYLKPHKSNTMGIFLQQHFSRYGKVFKSHLFGTPTIVSGDLELNNFILKNEDKLFQSSYPKSVEDILGKLSMMIVVDGELHKKLRTVTLNFIGTFKSSPPFIRYIEKLTISSLKFWKGQEISFAKEAKKLVFHLMLKSLLNIEPEESLASQLLGDYLTYMEGFVSLPLSIPGTPYSKALKARARISSTIQGILKERKSKGEKVGLAKGDFLQEILLNGELNDEETVSVVMDLLFAGYETTAGLLALLLYFLARSPNVLEQLKQEHQALKRRKRKGESWTWEDIQELDFNGNVIQEALRCGNLVKFVHRKALEDTTFKEYHIPAGWQVLPIFTAVHMDPSLHDSPSDFNPWRWNDRSMSKKVNPFGGGKRLCPGVDLAKLEATIFLHHLVLNYRWKMTYKDDFPVSYPYLEFKRGLTLEILPINI